MKSARSLWQTRVCSQSFENQRAASKVSPDSTAPTQQQQQQQFNSSTECSGIMKWLCCIAGCLCLQLLGFVLVDWRCYCKMLLHSGVCCSSFEQCKWFDASSYCDSTRITHNASYSKQPYTRLAIVYRNTTTILLNVHTLLQYRACPLCHVHVLYRYCC
jgi:hypothetical protein